ncbi:hypothetical protein BD408DRAFT_398823 [Parasitella parasitica]|nr:hypothetical protein BD408DRAFT_398823 [Parasitella parasitica]
MDYSVSVTVGRPESTPDANPSTSQVPPSSTTDVVSITSTTAEPVTSTTSNPITTDPPVTSTTSNAIPGLPTGEDGGPSNVGAIAGGVVGGVSAIVLIGFIVIILTRRRRNKNKDTSYGSAAGDTSGGVEMGPHPFGNDYSTYGTPTVISDNNSVPGSRPLSMSTPSSQVIKPRPFVQAYNPAFDEPQYAGYDGAHSPPQDSYYGNVYNQPYNSTYDNNNNNNNTTAYSHDVYYAQPQEPMIPASTSTTSNGRNVPDENDYDLSRKVSRHVPNEAPSVPHTR